MAMQKNVRICEDEGCEPILLPLDENDGSFTLLSLKRFFPKAIGLWYYTESDTIRGVKLTNGKFQPPMNGWSNAIYYCATLTETKPTVNNIKAEVMQNIDDIRIPEIKQEIEEDTQSVEQNNVESYENSNSDSAIRFLNVNDDRKIPTARRPHRCDICGNCFTQQSHMLRHRRIHTGEKPFACDQCSERFSRSDKLKLHFDRCHMAPISMLEPPKREPSPIKEKREKKPRVLDDSYDWSIRAPSSSNTSPSKTKHLTVRFKKTAKIDLDNGHDGYYSVVNMAEVEMEDDEPVSIMPVALAEIKKEELPSSSQEESTFVDTSNVSTERKPYRCEECFKTFAKKNQLQRHMRIHTGERPFRCQICMKSFTRIDALKRHSASMGHQKQKEQTDVDLESVTEILIDTYPDILPNGVEVDPLNDTNSEHRDANEDDDDDGDSETHCDVASFAQVTYANLEPVNSVKQEPEETAKNNCKKVKQGKENFCHQCNHLFTNKFNYNLHMESHKKVARTYKCSYCDYVFRRQSHLTRHILIHTGEKPFECKQCDERFSRSDKLKLHVQRTHATGYAKTITAEIQAGYDTSFLFNALKTETND